MGLSIGIVGLPNVGKSTLFNAITQAGISAENFPFCTIDPNTGIVEVPDTRLQQLADISGSSKVLPSIIEFTDIAGLVKGASKGEGLGNAFLSNIRETTAIAHVVRCFDDPNVVHVDGKVDPLADVEIINLELILADLDMAQKCLSQQQKRAKAQGKDEQKKYDLLAQIVSQLENSKPVRDLPFNEDDDKLLKGYHFLTQKKVVYVANVAEDELDTPNAHVKALINFAHESGNECLMISAQIEEEVSALDPADQLDYLSSLGLTESGLNRLAQSCFTLLGLQTYLTTGPKETRAWTIKKGDLAPQAAGVIHTDFEQGFIRANVVSFDDFIAHGGWKGVKEKGLLRQEGKEYVMHDGDVVEFLFNV